MPWEPPRSLPKSWKAPESSSEDVRTSSFLAGMPYLPPLLLVRTIAAVIHTSLSCPAQKIALHLQGIYSVNPLPSRNCERVQRQANVREICRCTCSTVGVFTLDPRPTEVIYGIVSRVSTGTHLTTRLTAPGIGVMEYQRLADVSHGMRSSDGVLRYDLVRDCLIVRQGEGVMIHPGKLSLARVGQVVHVPSAL